MRGVISSTVFVCSILFVGNLLAQTKVGVVDYQKLMMEIPFQSIMTNRMKQQTLQTQKVIQELNGQLMAKQKELNKKKESLSEDEKKMFKDDIKSLRAESSKKQMAMRESTIKLQKEIQSEIQEQIQIAAKQVAKKEGLSQVFRADSLIWDVNKVDVTPQVVNHLITHYKVTPEMKKTKMPPRRKGPACHHRHEH